MTDKRRQRRAKQARRDARRTRRRDREMAEEVSLVDEVAEALDSDHPLDLLALVSTLVQSTAPGLARLRNPDEPEPAGLDELVGAFIEAPIVETTALLAVLAEFVDDDALRARCHAEVARRDDELPRWVSDLGETRVDRAVRMTHILGDGDDVMFGVQLPDGHHLTAVVYVEHLHHSDVKDAFFIPDSLDAVLEIAEQNNSDPDIELVDMSLADVRAWVQTGVGLLDATGVSAQSDTWPAARPLLGWLVRGLPDGGAVYQPPDWELPRIEELIDRFVATDAGKPFGAAAHRDLLEACLYEGDPLRWSALRIEYLLSYSVTEDSVVPVQEQLDLPDLLRAFIPFAHAESGIRPELTAEALDAITDMAPIYADEVRAAALEAEEDAEDAEDA